MWKERTIHVFLAMSAGISVLTTVGIVAVLCVETVQFFQEVSPVAFLTGTEWSPLLSPRKFGVLPLACGTLQVAFGTAVVALPLGLASAIYLSEYSSRRFRAWVKPILEVLASIPSVVYGYFAIMLVSPLVRWIFPSAGVFNAASASIVVAIMVVPTVISLSEDMLRSVPQSLRDAGYAMGSTQFEVTTRIVVPAAFSGIMASFILAVARAIGETMAVTLAAGATPKMTFNPLESIQTMTAYIVQVSQGDTPTGTIEYQTIFAVCMTMFMMTVSMNVLAQWILAKFREEYE